MKGKNLVKKDYYIFNISFVLRAVGFGIFSALFNLYVLSIDNYPDNFLEIFLSIGNLSMAISSYFIGILIDKYSKRKLLIVFTLICSICMLLETTIRNAPIMYLISILYGMGAIGLFTLTPTMLKKYEEDGRKNLIISNRAINIISITVGSIFAGVLTGKRIGLSEYKTLLVVPFFYLISAFVVLFHSEGGNVEKKEYECKKEKKKKQPNLSLNSVFLIALIFALLGFAPMLVNYINVYFKNRFSLDIFEIAYIYAIISLLSGVFIIFLSRIDFRNIKYLVLLSLSIVIVNVLLMLWTNIFVQTIGVFLYICLYEVLTSCVYEYSLSKGKEELHGRLSGIIQASCNLSETLGIYVCGVCLGKRMFGTVFGLGIILTVISAIVVVVLLRKEANE